MNMLGSWALSGSERVILTHGTWYMHMPEFQIVGSGIRVRAILCGEPSEHQ